MKTTKLKKVTKENNEFFKEIVLLTLEIADKYKDQRAYEAALEGLYVGLNVYSEKKPTNVKLDLYLSWFIKTSIEYELGMETSDTKIWGSKKEGKKKKT